MENMLPRMKGAVMRGMQEVLKDQGRKTSSEVKSADATLVTPTDRRSQAAIIDALSDISGTCILAEESELDAMPESLVFLVDPLDGTRGFANGVATQTVIIGLYDKK